MTNIKAENIGGLIARSSQLFFCIFYGEVLSGGHVKYQAYAANKGHFSGTHTGQLRRDIPTWCIHKHPQFLYLVVDESVSKDSILIVPFMPVSEITLSSDLIELRWRRRYRLGKVSR